MKKIALIIVILWHSIVGESQQYYGQSWISGAGGAKIKFVNNNVNTKISPLIYTYFTSGNSNICDTNGNVLLCSDGMNIYDSNGAYIDGGDSMVYNEQYAHEDGWNLYSQSSIFLPMDSDKYYFVTPAYQDGNACWGCYYDIMLYSVIDMKANNGVGKVTKKMVHFLDNARLRRTQMMACRHGNGKDWWLLKQEGDSANVHIFLFTQDSVYDKGVQIFNEPVWGNWDIRGQSVFNQAGNQYASTTHADGISGKVFIAEFDRCYGKLSNPFIIEMPRNSQHDPFDTTITEKLPVGLAYSPNGQFLYVISMSNIYQYDLQDNTWFHVAGLDTTYQKFQLYETAYLAPNNKIYIGNFGGGGKQMSVIDNPDIKGAGCNFCPKCLRIDSLSNAVSLGTPPCMPNYGLGARVCYPESTEQLIMNNEELIIYPNPSSTIFYIKNKKGKKKELYNSVGELVLSTTKDEVNVSRLSSGLYYLKVDNQTKKVIVE